MDAATRTELLERLARMKSVGATILSNASLATKTVEAEIPVEPARPATLIGACPLTGGMSAAAGLRVITRWGEGVTVRLFASGGFGTIAPVLADAGRIIASWKPTLGQPLDRAAVLAALAALPAGSKVWAIHESDVKIIKGALTFDQAVAVHREFASIVREERPDLVLVGIVAGYRFAPGQDLARLDGYIDPATFDVLGVDLDGITDKYADFRTFIPGIEAYLERIGKTRWTVPEFGAPRIPSDPDGSVRAAWITEQVTALLALPNPPEDVCLFESTAYAGTELTASVEQDAWRALRTA